MTPMQRSLKLLRDAGWTCDVAERAIPGTALKRDLFKVADIVALRGPDILFVQTTTASNTAARCKKIADNPNLPAIRAAGIRVHVHGWRSNATLKEIQL